MKPIISPETLNTFPIDPCGDFTFEEDFAERSRSFHVLFTMKDDTKETIGWKKIDWYLFKEMCFN